MSKMTMDDLMYMNNVTEVQKERVVNFLEAHGEDATYDVLLHIHNTRKKQKREGKQPTYFLTLWNQYTKEYVEKSAGRERMDAVAQQAKEAKAAHERAKAKGYVPDKATIRKQLNNQLDKGDISQAQYDFGIIGLGYIHDMLSNAGVVIDMGPAVVADSGPVIDESKELVFIGAPGAGG